MPGRAVCKQGWSTPAMRARRCRSTTSGVSFEAQSPGMPESADHRPSLGARHQRPDQRRARPRRRARTRCGESGWRARPASPPPSQRPSLRLSRRRSSRARGPARGRRPTIDPGSSTPGTGPTARAAGAARRCPPGEPTRGQQTPPHSAALARRVNRGRIAWSGATPDSAAPHRTPPAALKLLSPLGRPGSSPGSGIGFGSAGRPDDFRNRVSSAGTPTA